MQHNLDRIVLRVVLVPLAPIVTNGISKDAAVLVECRCRNAASHVGISLETMLCVLVPEMERTIRTGCAKGPVDGVERDVVDRMDVYNVVDGRVSVALEGKVGTVEHG